MLQYLNRISYFKVDVITFSFAEILLYFDWFLQSKLRNYKARDNLDRPEGCLEALMQAVVCKDQIGWRNDSHKLIVLSTDSPYHIAGDAKVIFIRNDLTNVSPLFKKKIICAVGRYYQTQ